MSDWISVEDRLPTEDDVYIAGGFRCVLVWEKTREHDTIGYVRLESLHQYLKSETTHWMPLPEPPVKE